MSEDDEDTPRLGLAISAGSPTRGNRRRAGGELSPPPRSLSKRWQRRTYEFATPDAALVYTACAVAVSLVTGIWPVVEVHRHRVCVRLSLETEAGPGERLMWRELRGWARNLGAREVETGDGA